MSNGMDAMAGYFSFPKWAMTLFTAGLLGVAGWGLASTITMQSRITVLETKQAYDSQMQRDLKVQMDRIEETQLSIDETQKFILQNMYKIQNAEKKQP